MMMKKTFALVALLALAAAPLALAHDGHNNGKDKTVPGPNPHCWPTQNPHDYGAVLSERILAKTLIKDNIIWAAVVGDHNIEDCDSHVAVQQPAEPGDADFDGDYEFGWGGGFFPAGPWAEVCGYVAHHSDDVHVHDAIWAPNSGIHEAVGFWVGADPTPPTIVKVPPVVIDPDGVPDSGDEIVITEQSWDCVDDGCICQGDLDPDDWLKPCVHKCPIFPPPAKQKHNPLYGVPGGDGGYWVFIDCRVKKDGDVSLGLEDKDGDTIPDNVDPTIVPPTSVGAGCSSAGHIYFPNTWPGKLQE